jgi:hypothetical protein
MVDQSLRAAVREALLRHAITIPLWVGRIALHGMRDGPGVVLVLATDLLLAVLHRRANRIPERVDWNRFGQHDSWTKAFYLPEALSWYLIARDVLNVVGLTRQ